ncbi:hypothetical protein [Halobellus litoreus]|uniref:SWIM-type domain-containing protein n=1 Tax=Halobellus litoreus TaxID=755310 RepID=A0ABD6E193_9EURY|nr:hypothetical protein [Halobellus litoreus]
MAVTDSSTTPDSENGHQAQDIRAKRAREDDMDVALVHRGGCYEVDSASGNTYDVDLLDETCTCPDHLNTETSTPCKHVQRVQLELDAGRIPRPDGRLPETAVSEHSPDDESGVHLVATLRARIREREERIATLQAEIQALQFVCDVADVVGDGEEFELKQILADEYGPVSQL